MAGDAYVVAIDGLSALDSLDELPADIARSALRAVNKTVERARATAAKEMLAQVAFGARYLSGAEGRLTITKRATSGEDLEAVVTGRHRPTSLARFSKGSPGRGQKGVSVQVQPGLATFLPRAFLIKLRAGSDSTETRLNLGLAIRMAVGQVPKAAYKPSKIGANLWLLYGPSVDQVFSTVAGDIAPDMLAFMEAEFLRQMELN